MRCVVCTCRCRRCADRERDVRAGTQRRLAGDTRVRRASQPCARGRAGHVVPRHSPGCTAGRRHGGSAGRVDADVDAGDRAGVARRCRSVSLCRVQRPRRARQRYRQRRRASTACVFVAYLRRQHNNNNNNNNNKTNVDDDDEQWRIQKLVVGGDPFSLFPNFSLPPSLLNIVTGLGERCKLPLRARAEPSRQTLLMHFESKMASSCSNLPNMRPHNQ